MSTTNKSKSKTMSDTKFWITSATLAGVGVLGGAMAGLQPSGAGWRLFSYHPFLMTIGFVGMMGNAAIIKKLGGYANTKLHGNLAMGGLLVSFCGLYAIYKNKENAGKNHFTSSHSKAGLFTIIGSLMIGLVGGVFLNPDFGIAKTNKTIRKMHKLAGRLIIALGWMTCYFGLAQLTEDIFVIGFYMLPLVLTIPSTLI